MHVKRIKIYKGGKRKTPPAIDYGTPEQQYRRILMAGGTPKAAERSGTGQFARVTRWVDATHDEPQDKKDPALRPPSSRPRP